MIRIAKTIPLDTFQTVMQGNGPLPTGRIERADMDDWRRIVDVARANRWQVTCGNGSPWPDPEPKEFLAEVIRSKTWHPIHVTIGRVATGLTVLLNFFPQSVWRVDFDVDARELATQASLDLFSEAIRSIALATQEPVYLSHQDADDRLILKCDPKSGEFVLNLATEGANEFVRRAIVREVPGGERGEVPFMKLPDGKTLMLGFQRVWVNAEPTQLYTWWSAVLEGGPLRVVDARTNNSTSLDVPDDVLTWTRAREATPDLQGRPAMSLSWRRNRVQRVVRAMWAYAFDAREQVLVVDARYDEEMDS